MQLTSQHFAALVANTAAVAQAVAAMSAQTHAQSATASTSMEPDTSTDSPLEKCLKAVRKVIANKGIVDVALLSAAHQERLRMKSASGLGTQTKTRLAGSLQLCFDTDDYSVPAHQQLDPVMICQGTWRWILMCVEDGGYSTAMTSDLHRWHCHIQELQVPDLYKAKYIKAFIAKYNDKLKQDSPTWSRQIDADITLSNQYLYPRQTLMPPASSSHSRSGGLAQTYHSQQAQSRNKRQRTGRRYLHTVFSSTCRTCTAQCHCVVNI
jgi:hypothetical protein